MPGYITKSLHKFQHPTPKRSQHSLHDWTAPAYGSRVQYSQKEPDLPTLDPYGTQLVQSITCTLLYYSLEVYPTMLPNLNKISMQQSKPTAHTITKCSRLIDYKATYPNVVIHDHASDMILHRDMYAAYPVLPKAYSLVTVHFYFSDHPLNTDTPKPKLNGPILTVF